MKTKTIFKDKAGNKLISKFIKGRKIEQVAGYNKKGELVSATSLNTLIKRAGYETKTKIKGSGITTTSWRKKGTKTWRE
jgi:hypothetical protein